MEIDDWFLYGLVILGIILGYTYRWYTSKVVYCPKCDANYGHWMKNCRFCDGTPTRDIKYCPQKSHGVYDENS